MSKAPASVSKSGTRTVAPGVVDHSQELGHGNSPAAWTCVIVMLVGALIASIAFVIANTTIFIADAAGMVRGLILGYSMRQAGYGVDGRKLKSYGH